MKLLLTTFLSLFILTLQTVAQGYIFFANVTSDFSVEKPILGARPEDLVNSDYVAQLFWGHEGTSVGEMSPVDWPLSFLPEPVNSGLFLGPSIQIPGVPAGSEAVFQVRVWPSQYSSWYLGYQEAMVSPYVNIGASDPFRMKTGTEENPTELAIAMPRFALGAPEPATTGLLGLGAFGFYVLARRKPAKPADHCGKSLVTPQSKTETKS